MKAKKNKTATEIVHVGFKCPRPLYRRLVGQALKEDRSLSSLLRRAAERAIETTS